jgi:hypothetical protein
MKIFCARRSRRVPTPKGHSMKKEQTDFNRAVALGKHYAREALVATIAFTEAAPKDAAEAFAAYLQKNAVPHDVLYMRGDMITFATARDADVDTLGAESRTRKMVAAFFIGKYEGCKHMEAYHQEGLQDEAANENSTKPFAAVKRTVRRAA